MTQFLDVDQDFYLWFLLACTRDELYKARKIELDRYDLTFNRSAVLLIIHTIGEEATPTEISRRLVRRPHSISELVSRMEEKGLVSRVKDLGKKGRVKVKFTEKGREAYYQAIKRESIHEIMSCLSDEERQQLKSCLIKLKDKAQTVQDKAIRKFGSKYEMTFAPPE